MVPATDVILRGHLKDETGHPNKAARGGTVNFTALLKWPGPLSHVATCEDVDESRTVAAVVTSYRLLKEGVSKAAGRG
jgi:hypothetical protein